MATTLARVVFGILALLALATRAEAQLPGNWQVQQWNAGQARWDNCTTGGQYEVPSGGLADVRPTKNDPDPNNPTGPGLDPDYFEWSSGGVKYRILKRLIAKPSILEGLTQARNTNTKCVIYVNSNGTFNKLSLRNH